MLSLIQGQLEFEGWESPQFKSKTGLGRVGLAGFFLGVVLGAHLSALLVLGLVGDGSVPHRGLIMQWCAYVSVLSSFHFSEFLVTALYKPESVSYDSFVINHSKAYTSAALAAWGEFWAESLLLSRATKFRPWAFGLGLALVAVGQLFRAAAMWTCKSNFNHLIMEQRDPGHRLVTHGVYAWLRHPSYFGWFWWCVGTQLLLCNPVCVVLYAGAAWDFFRKRIPYEEATLVRFYPSEYPAYLARTRIGIPFIAGVVVPECMRNLPPTSSAAPRSSPVPTPSRVARAAETKKD